MKQGLLASLSGLLLIQQAYSAAVVPQSGFYGGLFGGAGYVQDIVFTNFFGYNPTNVINSSLTWPIQKTLFAPPLPRFSTELDYKVLGNGGLQIGYRCNHFRIEGEGLYAYAGINKLIFNNLILNYPFSLQLSNSFPVFSNYRINSLSSSLFLNVRGNTSLYGGLINAYYEFYAPDGGDVDIVPYVGAGIGYGLMQTTARFYFNGQQFLQPLTPPYSISNIIFNNNTESDSTHIYQGIVGLSYFLDDFTAVGTDLRLMRTGNIKTVNEKLNITTLNVNVNFSFDQPN